MNGQRDPLMEQDKSLKVHWQKNREFLSEIYSISQLTEHVAQIYGLTVKPWH